MNPSRTRRVTLVAILVSASLFSSFSIGSERELLIYSVSTNFWLYELAIARIKRENDIESLERISKNAAAFTFQVFVSLTELRKDDPTIAALLDSIKRNPFIAALKLEVNADPLGIMHLYGADGKISDEPIQFEFLSREQVNEKTNYGSLILGFREWLSHRD